MGLLQFKKLGNISSTSVLILFLALSSCVKKESEKVIVQERQAPDNVADSLSVARQGQQITIQKSTLEKAFLMTPSMVLSERTPQYADFKPIVVSFERAANKIGLFRLSANNLYNNIRTDKLMQTFNIVKEDKDSLTVDISSGFRNLILESNTEYVDKGFLDQLQNAADNGIESTVEIKDALVTKSIIENNTVYVEESVRITDIARKVTVLSNDNQSSLDSDPSKNEITARVVIELKPYKLNPRFKSKLFAKDQSVGYFISFATEAESEQLVPYIAHWDASDEAGPITVALENTIPAELQQAVTEGAQYWNLVHGKQLLKVVPGYKDSDRVLDRTIVIRWVKWDSAGFAYASSQADPMTGETLRAQIFMTSSWALVANQTVGLPKSNELVSQRSIQQKQSGLCLLEQKDLKLNEIYVQLNDQQKLKFNQDIIRDVVAHEMGHVMGLRHNFSGSNNHPGSDAELLKAKKDYLVDINHPGYAFTSSAMDYEDNLYTAITGAYEKHSVLPYDKAAIDWAYNDTPFDSNNLSYCSDEHIGNASSQGAKIYGCARFDALKNVVLGLAEDRRTSLNNTISDTFSYALAAQNSETPFKPKTNPVDEAYVGYYFGLGDLANILYSKKDAVTLISIQQAIGNFISSLSSAVGLESDSDVKAQVNNDLKELGGITGLVEYILGADINKNLAQTKLQDQVESFFKVLDVSKTGFTTDEMDQIKLLMQLSAVSADKTVLPQVMAKLSPIIVQSFPFQTQAQYDDSQIHPEKYPSTKLRLKSDINLGNVTELFDLYTKAILSRELAAKDVVISGQNLKLNLLSYSNSYRNTILKAFVLENWPVEKRSEVQAELTNHLETLKKEVVKNTLQVLQAANVSVAQPVNYDNLSTALNSVSFSSVVGLNAYELNAELLILQKIEQLKADLE